MEAALRTLAGLYGAGTVQGKRRISAAGKKRIAAAQKARVGEGSRRVRHGQTQANHVSRVT